MRKIIHVLLLTALLASPALAQLPVVPGSPEQVNRALAEAPAWADEAVELLVSRGIYIGYPDGSFGWQDDITRAEMAMVIARLISSFDLDQFHPDELMVLRRAAEQLNDDLAALAALVEQHDHELAAAADQLQLHEDELARLWAALTTLDAAPEVFDATELWNASGALEQAAAEREEQLNELTLRLDALDPDADTGELWAHLEALEAGQAAAEVERARLGDELAELRARVAALEAAAFDPSLLADLELRLSASADRLALLEGRVSSLEVSMNAAAQTLADHEERIGRLEEALLPERAPFHVSLALYGSAPDGGLVGQ